MRITIYSGSFNPVHKGHEALANYLITNKITEEVWLVVSPSNPLKNSTGLIDQKLRLAMVQYVTKAYSNICASDVEFDMPVPSYSIDTLKKLSRLYPQHEFSLLIGSDNAIVFDKWKDYEVILRNYKVFVYPRSGDDLAYVKQKYPVMEIIDAPVLDISSTQIRDLIRHEKDCSTFLHPDVLSFIQQNALYQGYNQR